MTIRVVLADDQALLRATFRLLIESAADMCVVGEAGDGGEAVDLAQRERPDVVVMDVRMPVLDGIAATTAIRSDPELDGVRVLILTTFEVEELIVDALRAGASGYLGKDVEPVELLSAIRVITRGDALLSSAATRAVISRVVTQPRSASSSHSSRLTYLTPREREILTFVGLGMTNDEIAAHLVISPATAKTHVNRTMTKLRVGDRAQLVITAYEAGLVLPGHPPID